MKARSVASVVCAIRQPAFSWPISCSAGIRFLAGHWRPSGGSADVAGFREAAVAAGYLYRSVPRRYGGSEQPSDVLKARVIREEFTAARAPGVPGTLWVRNPTGVNSEYLDDPDATAANRSGEYYTVGDIAYLDSALTASQPY